MNNKVFYQHPNLMRALGMHETVMQVMVSVLGGGESKVGPWRPLDVPNPPRFRRAAGGSAEGPGQAGARGWGHQGEGQAGRGLGPALVSHQPPATLRAGGRVAGNHRSGGWTWWPR